MTTFHGIVQKGAQRGKKLGFPTANIPLPYSIPEGIYISQTQYKRMTFPSLTFIGAAKTFDATDVLSETWIMDFDRDIYGEELEIDLIKKIRDNMKFSSSEELVRQMEDDKMKAKAFFSAQHEDK
jgi:riboflavin kinase / FMN adenylyltransferase